MVIGRSLKQLKMTKGNKEHAIVVGGSCDMTKEFSGSVGSTTRIGTIYDYDESISYFMCMYGKNSIIR
jgi:hypothetical protein